MADVRLILGDCLEEMAEVPDGSVHLILADLPYGTSGCRWDVVIPFGPLWAHYRRLLGPGGAVVLTAVQPFTSLAVLSNPEWFRYTLVWEKGKPTGFLWARKRPMACHEDIVVFAAGWTTYNAQKTPGKPYVRGIVKECRTESLRQGRTIKAHYDANPTGDRWPRSVLRFPTPEGRGKFHPTQKPVALMEYLIRTYSDPGETVLDNAMGSGTTGEACLNTGRNFVGIEKDPAIFAIAERRIGAARARHPLFAGIG